MNDSESENNVGMNQSKLTFYKNQIISDNETNFDEYEQNVED